MTQFQLAYHESSPQYRRFHKLCPNCNRAVVNTNPKYGRRLCPRCGEVVKAEINT